jgi:transcription antitermination factor NusG
MRSVQRPGSKMGGRWPIFCDKAAHLLADLQEMVRRPAPAVGTARLSAPHLTFIFRRSSKQEEERAMPLLPLEPCLFPGDLFDKAAFILSDAQRWWVLHTRPRAEKALARHLVGRGLSFFLPVYHRQWRNRGRRQSSYLPLFPGYVFLRGDDEARVSALTTNLVVNVLREADQGQLEADLRRVNRLMNSGLALSPEERLAPGTVVRLTAGPFKGLEGKILRRGKELRFVVEVHLLQRGVSVDVDGWMMEPLVDPLAAAPLCQGN